MEARHCTLAIVLAALLSLGASYRTDNFIVTAATPALAKEVGDAAEKYRRDLAREWLGKELATWSEPCSIHVEAHPGALAGGETSFAFIGGQPVSWQMSIQGTRERVLDSVLPHEITHTIFATHFGCPLPRWADEGACTTVEHAVERNKHNHLLIEFLTSNRGIAFNEMFAMTDYPRDILPLYSQGYSLARFLIAQGGKQKYVRYIGDGLAQRNWTAATRHHYGFDSLSELQITWLDWVRRGSPELPSDSVLVNHEQQVDADAADRPLTQLASLEQPVAQGKSVPKKELPSRGSLAARSSGGSWYARQRDVALASRHANRDIEYDARESDGEGVSHSRPTGVTRAEERILQSSASTEIEN